MRLFVNTATGAISQTLTGPRLPALTFTLRDLIDVDITFVTDGADVTATTLAASAVLRTGLKVFPNTTLLAGTSTHTLVAPGGGAPAYARCVLSLKSGDLVNHFTTNVSPGTTEATGRFEIEVTANDDSRQVTYAQIPATIRRGVNDPGDEAGPDAEEQAEAAAASAAAAATSATAAATSATAAATSATNAATSATAAGNSATAAASSATAASASETAAGNSATAATTSATNAATSATNAGNSATAAASSASAASASETAAGNSATAAATSATNASNSASAAATSATAAATSATSAGTSETNSAASALLAASYAGSAATISAGVRNSLASEAGLACNGAAATNRITATLTAACALSSDPRGFFFKFRTPSAAPSSNTVLWTWGDAASPTTQFIEFVHTTADALRIRIYGTTTSDYRETTLAGLLSNYGAMRDVCLCFGADSTARELWANGVAATLTSDTTAGTAPSNWQAALTSTVWAWHGGSVCVFKNFWPVNFRPASTDALDSYFIGGDVPQRFQWATQATQFYTSNFSAGADSWSTDAPTNTAGNIDADADGAGVPPSADWLRVSGSGTSTRHTYRNFTGSFTLGAPVRAKADVFIPTGSIITHIAASNAGGTLASRPAAAKGIAALTAGASTSISLTFVPLGGLLLLQATNVSGGDPTFASGVAYYVKNLTFTRCGALFFLSPQASRQGMGFQLQDVSTNTVDASIPTSGWSWTHPTPIGGRFAIRGSIAHSAISTSDGSTLFGIRPPGSVVVEFNANLDAGFDSGVTFNLGSSGTSALFVSALAVSTTGFKQAASLSAVPSSLTATQSIYGKKSASTTVGNFLIYSIILERKY